MTLQEVIYQLVQRQDLSLDQMKTVMQQIMSGAATPAQIAGFLVALRMKGETVEEITAAAQTMRELSIPLSSLPAKAYTDIVGTGGDQHNLFNVSTASAFVMAAAGAHVAKHGNRSVSSSSGSADLLEAAGININLTAAQVVDCINTLDIGFLFAPLFHPAIKHAMPTRKELGLRTLFNLLGPLANPVHPSYQLLGVYEKQWLTPLAKVSNALGVQHIMVVHSADGLDEISIAASTYVAEIKQGQLREYTINPRDYGFNYSTLAALTVSNAAESFNLFQAVLNNTAGAARDMILLNAGAGIYVAGLAENLAEGIVKAQAALESGAAKAKFAALRTLSNNF